MASHAHDRIPAWSWIAPAAASVLLALKTAHLVPPEAALVLLLSGLLIAGTVFAAVHHAELLAVRIGEPFGSLLLAVSVTVIEVALIVSIMLSGAPGSEAVARDTVFSAVMIVLNIVVGLALIIGGHKHGEQTFQSRSATGALAVVGTLAVLALVLPNFTSPRFGPSYSPTQLTFVGAVSLALYLLFVFVQTVKHRDYFLDEPADADESDPVTAPKPSNAVSLASLGLLLLSLAAVVLLAKILSAPLDRVVASAGLPHSFVGVVIAAVVLLPESIAAVKAARLDRLQTSVNLALGSAIASIGLTIPVVGVVSQIMGSKLELGVPGSSMVLLFLTLLVSALTLGTGRTTVLQGGVHLVIGAVFVLLAAVP
jgi:Ca2+:H+ antiporter